MKTNHLSSNSPGKRPNLRVRLLPGILALILCLASPLRGAPAAVLGWNNLGMHCMDKDFSVFSILPPYNTIEAQLIVNGLLITDGAGYSITYQAIADPSGSFNSTSIGKGNFYTFTPWLYGTLSPDAGLAGWGMPGPANTPQGMLFEITNHPAAGVATRVNWFRAEGIPLTPYDNALAMNTYPMMRLIARDPANNPIATNDIVLPVSDEMDCRACHASGSTTGAQPLSGWVNDSNPERDYRLNILRLHDDLEFLVHNAEYTAALTARGFNTNGLYPNVAVNGKPVLCAACHASEALGAPSYGNIPPLTASVHGWHAHVRDPQFNGTLDSSDNRAACYRCHPGSTTRCLRGAMGSAVAPDGSMAMQCQSCHGTMSQVGSTNRIGWFMEPACQSCHTGTATHNNGQIRYTSVFSDTNGTVRTAVDATFATTPNSPAAGLSLYRFSVGHGGLQCEACHGSTHAEFPSAHPNDNIRNIELQGHAGPMSECSACHPTVPSTVNGGPHGMHPVGQAWVSQHPNVAESNRTQCQACHGTDYRGTVLSLAQADRTLSAFGTQNFFRGAIIGCYTCHNGPGGEGTPPPAPTVSNVSASTAVDQPVAIVLLATGTNLTLRIISQAANGTVGLSNRTATYFPDPGFAGTDTFTFAAYNGSKNSTLATATVVVGAGSGAVAPVITTQPVSQTVTVGANVSFSVVATGTAPLSYQWQKNGVNLAGATRATLTLAAVTTANAGSYRLIISNAAGSVTSAAATLTVNSTVVAPTITTQPISQTVAAGANVSFSVVATGTAPLRYQWQKSGVNLTGATSAILTLTAVTSANAGSYRVIVSNSAGSIASATATLTVKSNPITISLSSPINGAVYTAPAYVRLTANITSSTPIARVQFYDGTNLLGTTTASPFTMVTKSPAAGGHVLTAKATDIYGASATSAPVQITVRQTIDDDSLVWSDR